MLACGEFTPDAPADGTRRPPLDERHVRGLPPRLPCKVGPSYHPRAPAAPDLPSETGPEYGPEVHPRSTTGASTFVPGLWRAHGGRGG